MDEITSEREKFLTEIERIFKEHQFEKVDNSNVQNYKQQELYKYILTTSEKGNILPIIGNVLPFLLRNCCYILWQAEKGRCISETFRRDY